MPHQSLRAEHRKARATSDCWQVLVAARYRVRRAVCRERQQGCTAQLLAVPAASMGAAQQAFVAGTLSPYLHEKQLANEEPDWRQAA